MFRLVVTLLMMMGLGINACFASQNFLNSVVFEHADGQYNVLLRSDKYAKIKKTVQSPSEITLITKDLTCANNLTTIYKNFDKEGRVIVENGEKGELRLHIISPNVASANIIFNTPDSAPIYVGERFGQQKTNWAFSMLIIGAIVLFSTNKNTRRIAIRRELRDREIEFYKAKLPRMNYQPTYRYSMNSIQKETAIK